MTPCSKCGNTEVRYRIQIRDVLVEHTDPRIPKYTIAIKEECAQCEKYIRFAPQTPKLIDKLREELRNVRLKG